MPAATGVVDTGSVQVGVISIATANADYTLVQAEWENGVIITTGALTANRNLNLPSALEGMLWVLDNQCTGAFSIVFKVSGQTGVTVANGKTAVVRGTATDIRRVTADV